MKPIAVGAGVVVALLVLSAAAVGGIAADDTDSAEEDNATFGAEVSSFMQASNADAEDSVDTGMFNASMQRAETPEERRAIIEARTERLQERQERLAALRENVSEGDSSVGTVAAAARVNVGAAHLERSAERTNDVAREVGVDTEALEEIRTNASDLRGPEIAAIARTLGGSQGAHELAPGVDSSGNESDATENRSAGNGSDRAAADDRSDAGPPHTQDDERGPSDNTGDGDEDDGQEADDEEDDGDEHEDDDGEDETDDSET